LRLEPPDSLEQIRHRDIGPREQSLAVEQCQAEVTLRESGFLHSR